MTILFFKRAVEDFRNNRLLNIITLLTISLSILIVSAFILFFINTNEIMNFWKKGLRVMAYLRPELPGWQVPDLTRRIQSISGVETVRFVPKKEAFTQLKAQMKRQASLFDNLGENPLPDAFEIRILTPEADWQKIESIATRIFIGSKRAGIEPEVVMKGVFEIYTHKRRFSHIYPGAP